MPGRKGWQGRKKEWENEEGVVWPDVKGIYGFWGGSVRVFGCGASMWVKVFTLALGWQSPREVNLCPIKIRWMRKSAVAQ